MESQRENLRCFALTGLAIIPVSLSGADNEGELTVMNYFLARMNGRDAGSSDLN
jgi:hypothetical protein